MEQYQAGVLEIGFKNTGNRPIKDYEVVFGEQRLGGDPIPAGATLTLSAQLMIEVLPGHSRVPRKKKLALTELTINLGVAKLKFEPQQTRSASY